MRRLLLLLLGALLLSAPVHGRAAARPESTPEQAAAPAGRRVGLQIGHLRVEELPDDQERLRGQTGGAGGGYREVDVNQAIVLRVAALLTARGVTVDILPAAVPAGYRADAFVAIHCDANSDSGLRGYKLARYRDSLIPARDDALIETLSATYAAATGLPRDPNVSRNMTGYYAYNARRYTTIVDRQTPAVIFELGFLTHPLDRAILVTRQDQIAGALADGIVRFLTLPPPAVVLPAVAANEAPIPVRPGIERLLP